MNHFETIFLEEARKYLRTLDIETRKKVLYNIDIAQQTRDTSKFKKLRNDIWEFRIQYRRQQIRLLAFWTKSESKRLVIATHGFTKKTQKTPDKEIKKAQTLRREYLNREKKKK